MKAALLGYGTVGRGIDAIWKAEGLKDPELTKILVRRKEAMQDERFTLDFGSIINDENIGVVIEAMGAFRPTRRCWQDTWIFLRRPKSTM